MAIGVRGKVVPALPLFIEAGPEANTAAVAASRGGSAVPSSPDPGADLVGGVHPAAGLERLPTQPGGPGRSARRLWNCSRGR
jgi:hypothetical protein